MHGTVLKGRQFSRSTHWDRISWFEESFGKRHTRREVVTAGHLEKRSHLTWRGCFERLRTARHQTALLARQDPRPTRMHTGAKHITPKSISPERRTRTAISAGRILVKQAARTKPGDQPITCVPQLQCLTSHPPVSFIFTNHPSVTHYFNKAVYYMDRRVGTSYC